MPASRICFDIETVGPNDGSVIAMLRDSLIDSEPPATVARNSGAERVLERAGRLDYYRGLTKGKGEWLEQNWGTTLLDARLQQAVVDAAVDTLLARSIVICAAVDDDKPVLFTTRNTDECPVLMQFIDFFNDAAGPDTWIIGHNNRGFDIPVLTTRFRRHKLIPPRHFPRWVNGRIRGNVYDTMQESASNKPYVSAQKAAIAHGLDGFKVTMWGDRIMDGSLVAEAYAAGAWDVLEEYCTSDVLASRELAKVLTYDWQALNEQDGPNRRADWLLRGRFMEIAMKTACPVTRNKLLAECLVEFGIITQSEVAALSA